MVSFIGRREQEDGEGRKMIISILNCPGKQSEYHFFPCKTLQQQVSSPQRQSNLYLALFISTVLQTQSVRYMVIIYVKNVCKSHLIIGDKSGFSVFLLIVPSFKLLNGDSLHQI